MNAPITRSVSAVLSLFAGLYATIDAAAQNPVWKGRTFVKVLAKGDPIPGTTGANFGVIERFTLRDGKLHIVAGEAQTKKGLFRWHKGALTKLVYTDTLSPTGSTFDTVHFTTDETEGALNFFGEVFYGRPGFVYGLFEWRDGKITKVFDSATPVGGKTLNGFGYPVRVGHEVVGSAQFFENGALKNGIFRWDGTTLRTIIQTDDDLPGSLGGFTGQPGQYQVAFDGQNVGFVASADPLGRGPNGIYRAGPDGVITKLIDGNDKHPAQNGSKTYFQRGVQFVNVDLDGPLSFLGVSEMVSAAGGGKNSFYGLGARFSDGTINVGTATFGTDGNAEALLPYPDGITPPKLDGQALTGITLVDGDGDDVALLVRLADGTQAIYAAIAAAPVTPTEVKLGAVTFVPGGPLGFTLPTQTGVSYVLETKAGLADPTWTVAQTISGDGSVKKLEAALAGLTGFFRVRVQ